MFPFAHLFSALEWFIPGWCTRQRFWMQGCCSLWVERMTTMDSEKSNSGKACMEVENLQTNFLRSMHTVYELDFSTKKFWVHLHFSAFSSTEEIHRQWQKLVFNVHLLGNGDDSIYNNLSSSTAEWTTRRIGQMCRAGTILWTSPKHSRVSFIFKESESLFMNNGIVNSVVEKIDTMKWHLIYLSFLKNDEKYFQAN